jgi:hypothetical protein
MNQWKEDDLKGACETVDVLHDPYMAALAMMADMKQTHSVTERYSRLEQRLMNGIYRALR